MREVTILGLWRCDPSLEGIVDRREFGGELWTILNWKASYPFLPYVERCYELHGYVYTEMCIKLGMCDGYFPEDWKDNYKNACKELVVWDEDWLELRSDARLIDYSRLEREFGAKLLSSTGSTMLCECILEGVDKVNIRGFSMKEAYGIEAWGMMQAIRLAESKGMEIDCPHRERWESKVSDPDCPKPNPYIEVCKALKDFCKKDSTAEFLENKAIELLRAE